MSSSSFEDEPSLASSSQTSDATPTVPPKPVTTSSTADNMAASASASPSSSLDSQIERLKRCEYLKENEVKNLCLRAREILVDEGNVQRVDAPVTVRTLLGQLYALFLDS